MGIIIVLLLSSLLNGGDIIVNLKSYPKEVILGEPIYVCVEAEYKGDGVIKIGRGERGFKVYGRIERVDGREIKQMRPPTINWVLYHNFEEIRNGWKEEVCKDISELKEIEEGEYYITGEVRSEGPYFERIGDGREVVEREAWRGKVQSEKVVIRVKYPEGEDKKAYEYFKKTKWGGVPLSGEGAKEVLEKFPTSTYAGWVLAPFFHNVAPFGNGRQIIDNAILPEEKRTLKISGKKKNKDGKYVLLTSEENALRYINIAEQFVKANKNDKNLGDIYAGMSLCYMYLREWEKAYYYGKKSLEKRWSEHIYFMHLPDLEKQRKVLEEAIEEMVIRGLVKGEK